MKQFILSAIIGLSCGLASACQPNTATQPPGTDDNQNIAPTDYLYEQTITIPTVDDRDLIYYVDRPVTDTKVPILLIVDGSSCIGQLRPNSAALYRPGPEASKPFARVMVEKPGVEATADYPSECSETFFKYYTIEQRVIDHFRALQHLAATADWWDGTLYVWGWSDGGDIAGQLIAYYPNVERAVLGAMGGGYTMAEHFRDYWICSEERAGEQREGCIEKLDVHFQAMFDNPTWEKTWSGPDNAWKVWPSRLHSRLSNLLADNQTPILIVQGADDFDSTPAASARKLVEDLQAAGNVHFTYWEFVGMKHGWGSLPDEGGEAVKQGMFDWLMHGAVDPETLPLMTDAATGL